MTKQRNCVYLHERLSFPVLLCICVVSVLTDMWHRQRREPLPVIWWYNLERKMSKCDQILCPLSPLAPGEREEQTQQINDLCHLKQITKCALLLGKKQLVSERTSQTKKRRFIYFFKTFFLNSLCQILLSSNLFLGLRDCCFLIVTSFGKPLWSWSSCK